MFAHACSACQTAEFVARYRWICSYPCNFQLGFTLLVFELRSRENFPPTHLRGKKKLICEIYDVCHLLQKSPTQRPAQMEDMRIVALIKSQSVNKSATREKKCTEKSQNKALPCALNIYPAIRTLLVYAMSYNGHLIFEGYCHVQPLSRKHKTETVNTEFVIRPLVKLEKNEEYAAMLPSP